MKIEQAVSDGSKGRYTTSAWSRSEGGYVGESFFLKLGWPEEDHVSEHGIIREALKRADLNLPKDLALKVKEHMPEVKATVDLHDTSTAIIRNLLGADARGSRIQRGTVSAKLHKIHAQEPDVFWRAYWETVHCKSCGHLKKTLCH